MSWQFIQQSSSCYTCTDRHSEANQRIFVTFSCKHIKMYGLIKCTECDTLSVWSQPRMLRNRYITDKDLFCCVFCNVMLSETKPITRMGSTIFHIYISYINMKYSETIPITMMGSTIFHIHISYINMKYSETILITRMGSTTGTIQRPGHG